MAMYIHPRCECDTHDEEANGRVGASRPERWLGGVLHPVRLPGIDMLWSPLPLVLLPSHASAAAREGQSAVVRWCAHVRVKGIDRACRRDHHLLFPASQAMQALSGHDALTASLRRRGCANLHALQNLHLRCGSAEWSGFVSGLPEFLASGRASGNDPAERSRREPESALFVVAFATPRNTCTIYSDHRLPLSYVYYYLLLPLPSRQRRAAGRQAHPGSAQRARCPKSRSLRPVVTWSRASRAA